jgi:hypothetical protein
MTNDKMIGPATNPQIRKFGELLVVVYVVVGGTTTKTRCGAAGAACGAGFGSSISVAAPQYVQRIDASPCLRSSFAPQLEQVRFMDSNSANAPAPQNENENVPRLGLYPKAPALSFVSKKDVPRLESIQRHDRFLRDFTAICDRQRPNERRHTSRHNLASDDCARRRKGRRCCDRHRERVVVANASIAFVLNREEVMHGGCDGGGRQAR